ncbi:hypothetical protein B0T09DRAFT_265983, partial [Sordaria sp. MPI-SDFR-AT-0083]
RICVKEDDEDANTSNGGWDESELDKNLKQLSLTTLKSWDDPFVGAHPRPPPRNKNGSTATKSTNTDIRKKKQRLREATLARMEQINEKLQPWENGESIMTRAQAQEVDRLCDEIPTRAQAQEVDRLCDEYYQICAALPPPQDLSPSGSSALPHSHSSYLNNNTDHYSDSYNNTSGDSSDTNSGTNPGTNSGPIDWIMALRTKEDFEKYHEHQKIKFGRKDPEDYNLMDMDSVQLNRRGREEMLSVVLGNKKGRLGKYWDWLAQRSGEMDREMELNGPTRHTRVPTRSPSDNFTGFYEKFVRHYGH